ncbi:bifunctional UDP-2,4-diacetamido-2,4,6-trideoxy-beta-L-altropyranose hydrolase/GNAT family N-acetyltransferase [Pseudonocardia sp. HH130630-07]|uniref:bifunctional UDP-2,4-diacetamido-2,4,6-trideoxy-beta-L-altropyranose hydrolase/GNAT family N-acetyltransferase n=1 Tax=Pseudonocardia sp. HH130630-07 TaxID=1690815 RepID=UPI00081519F6|nr:bifunctional UDP-2,4-diacetamido-2,4,6-trideoxy-beta-L-altropyranose hydrolase/GNAT family N-acetyltransferase [Pseudonocardia sp. HH130630-07]ANY06653.1 hypothetical protein AFB00_10500 [Pseudonocardia sp. HH130630-07]
MRLLLRCDAGPSTGVGHAVRCAAVAEAAGLSGHEVFWSGRLDGLGWLWDGLLQLGWSTDPRTSPAPEPGPPGTLLAPADTAAELARLCRTHRIDAVHVDHYLLGTDLRAALGAEGVTLSTVEDFGTGRRPGDLVVDPNLGADGHPRPDDGSPALLRGPGFAPLRHSARRARRIREIRDRTPAPDRVPAVLVVMGGTDAAGLLGPVVTALAGTGVAAAVDVVVPAGRSVTLPDDGPVRFRAVAPLPDLPAAMAEADLVVSAAGTTVWELCCVAVPMALLRAADNQTEGYRTVVASGAAAGLGGPADLVDPGPATAVLHRLLTDPGARDALAARAGAVVDGMGANRIVDAIAGSAGNPARDEIERDLLDGILVSRDARTDDAELLLRWRNDPETRRRSRSRTEITLDDHRRWLTASLARDDRRLLVVDDVTGPVGTVRWDLDDGAWEVSITVAPERRGARLALPLLLEGERALRAVTGPGTPVTAVVHAENTASARLFARAGYADDGTGPDPDGFHTLRRVL